VTHLTNKVVRRKEQVTGGEIKAELVGTVMQL
jgi:hypothetical protein